MVWLVVMVAGDCPLFLCVTVGQGQVLHAPGRLSVLPSY